MPKKYDLIVIGGGILGASAAYHALQMGKTVALIERHHAPASATVRNFGQIVPSGLKRSWKKYGASSLAFYHALHNTGLFPIRHFGSYYIASTESELQLLYEQNEMDLDQGIESVLLDPIPSHTILEGLKPDYVKGTLYYANEVSVDPPNFVRTLIEYMQEQMGLHYYPYTIAIDAQVTGDDVVVATNTKQTLTGDQLLICNGAEYQFLFPDLYKNEEIEAVKIHMMKTVAQPTQKIRGNILTGLSIQRYESFKDCPSYARFMSSLEQDPRIREWGIHILFKQNDAGEVIIGDSHHYADAHDQESLHYAIEQPVIEFIMELARAIFQLQRCTLQASWYGIYTQAKKEDIIQKSIHDRIHIVNAIGGKGMTAGPGFMHHFITTLYQYDHVSSI